MAPTITPDTAAIAPAAQASENTRGTLMPMA